MARVVLQQSGGFLGLLQTTDASPADLSSTFEDLFKRFVSARAELDQMNADPARRDARQYVLRLEPDDGTPMTLEFDETTVPPSLNGVLLSLEGRMHDGTGG